MSGVEKHAKTPGDIVSDIFDRLSDPASVEVIARDPQLYNRLYNESMDGALMILLGILPPLPEKE